MTISVLGLDHVVLRTEDPEALVSFYKRLFACDVERTVGDFLWQLRIGDSLLDVLKGERNGANVDHFCLRVADYDEPQILSFLESEGAEASSAGEIYGAQGFGPSIYFVDPEGNRVELKRANV